MLLPLHQSSPMDATLSMLLSLTSQHVKLIEMTALGCADRVASIGRLIPSKDCCSHQHAHLDVGSPLELDAQQGYLQ